MPKFKFTIKSLEIPEAGIKLQDLSIETESTVEEYIQGLETVREMVPVVIKGIKEAASKGQLIL